MAIRTVGRRLRYQVRDRLGQDEIRVLVQRALAGGAELGERDRRGERKVLWDDFGDQVLVYVDSVVVRLIKRFVVVSVDLETEQTGRAPLIVTLAFGSTQDGAGLVATSDELPRGDPLLASRWGRVLQETLWSVLLGLSREHAAERGKVPLSMHVLDGRLRFGAVPALELGKSALRAFESAFPRRPDGGGDKP